MELLSFVLNEENYIDQFCTGALLENETLHFEGELPKDFFDDWYKYKVFKKSGKYTFEKGDRELPEPPIPPKDEIAELKTYVEALSEAVDTLLMGNL